MTLLELSRWDVPSLAGRWRASAPFPHAVIDDALPDSAAARVAEDLAEESCDLVRDQIFEFYASPPGALEGRVLRQLRDELASTAMRDALSSITGIAASRLEMRAFAYHRGHYLLPHTDRDVDDDRGRAVAYTYYAPTPAAVRGGELELFALEDERSGAATSALLIEPRPNRLVLFEVTRRSLHQVREVEDGVRLSVAGWFYR